MAAKPDPEMAMTTAMSGLMPVLHVIRESVKGYRTQLEADGWSPTMAEMMAGQLHSVLVAKMFK